MAHIVFFNSSSAGLFVRKKGWGEIVLFQGGLSQEDDD